MKSPYSGQLYIFSAPSGAGKTSLVEALLESTSGIAVSVSHTTRAMRPGEEEGVHYHFIDTAAFEKMVEAGAFLEDAKVFDNYYGTSQQAVEGKLSQGEDIILEIDWQGAAQVRKKFEEAVGIFIIPPSTEELQNRLQGRGQDSGEIIQRRMQDAVSEMSHFTEFDYLLVNDDFAQALQELSEVVRVQRLITGRQAQKLQSLLGSLLASAAD